jgi:hypothetical protein
LPFLLSFTAFQEWKPSILKLGTTMITIFFLTIKQEILNIILTMELLPYYYRLRQSLGNKKYVSISWSNIPNLWNDVMSDQGAENSKI